MVSASSPGLKVANKQLHIAIKKDTDANEKRMVIWVTMIPTLILMILCSLTTRLPMTTVARKKGTQTLEETSMQSHMDSIHSPHSTRKTIMKL